MGELAVMNRATPVQSFTMGDMETVANAIARSGMFGSKDPYAVLTLCMLAQAEGQHPAVVFRDYHVISGKPSKKAEAMQRDFLAAGGRIEWLKLTDDECEATFSHPQGGTATISWDKNRVKQAQLGSNAMHGKYPRQMLRSRVISEGVRTVFPGATSGLYESGEVADMIAQDTPATPVATRARDLKGEAALDNGRTKAESWVANQTAQVSNAADHVALDAIIAGGHKAVAKLAREHVDLHGQVNAAYEAKRAEFNALDHVGSEFGLDPIKPVTLAPDFTDRLAKCELRADFDKLEDEFNTVAADLANAEYDRVKPLIEAALTKFAKSA